MFAPNRSRQEGSLIVESENNLKVNMDGELTLLKQFSRRVSFALPVCLGENYVSSHHRGA